MKHFFDGVEQKEIVCDEKFVDTCEELINRYCTVNDTIHNIITLVENALQNGKKKSKSYWLAFFFHIIKIRVFFKP